ncbi:VOC family protein [uncultured Aquimarina sp.]|uniref:VOC family protein n=2 Tax=uncultured Aquimarina sp. TaxID=575652 RepID=UPI002609A38F|nr:VOC family protein [uncultured Aquimarina sp.]
MKKAPFHLALPCEDIEKTKNFYTHKLGAELGRSTNSWIDINLHGNQITFTKAGNFQFIFKSYRLGNQILPAFHFGIIIDSKRWDILCLRLLSMNLDVTSEVTFFENEVGEQNSLFVKDPNGYMVEFKSFKNANEVFENDEDENYSFIS